MFSGTMGREKGSTIYFLSLIKTLSFKHKPKIEIQVLQDESMTRSVRLLWINVCFRKLIAQEEKIINGMFYPSGLVKELQLKLF